MRTKFLLFVLLMSVGAVQAQDTIRSLIISEACLRNNRWAYAEITNMGNEDVQLANFTFGRIDPWEAVVNLTGEGWVPRNPIHTFRLPERILAPGESFLIASVFDYSLELHAKGIDTPGSGSAEVMHNKEIAAMADMQIHQPEGGENSTLATDSVSPMQTMTVWWARDTWYIQQHFPNGDSLVVDQVNGVFDDIDGLNTKFSNANTAGYDVAGIPRASFTAYLIRRFNVKQGNLDFANARGVGIGDSEWIPIPIEYTADVWTTGFRAAQWTVGNHVNAQLNENTLESDVVDVDYANKTLTIPWGIRRNDDIMNYFVRKPGIGWNYHRAAGTSVDDSLSFAAKTGDKLELWACGDDMQKATFEIIVEAPTSDVKLVIPKLNQDPEGNWRNQLKAGMISWPRVTQHDSGTDTIWGVWGGIPYQTRIDTLMKRLEIPSNATWELITVDGVQRPDIKKGDVLKIMAENGSEKDYYISVNDYKPSQNAFLSSITWPDISEIHKVMFGWTGDTIPNFNRGTFNYTVTVPKDVNGIPALVAKTEDLNATVDVKRATSLSGTKEGRTITFTVTAEDDTTVNIYTVELVKETEPGNIQPFGPDPFISEKITKKQWRNGFLEVCNPGNQIMDLSNYMFVSSSSEDPVEQVESTAFDGRYKKYIPGYKWSDDEAEWAPNPGIVQLDLSVNSIVMPGDVFVMADIQNSYNHTPFNQIDVDFNNHWGDIGSGNDKGVAGQWQNAHVFVFKILNDSIKKGLKPATDINDFELVDAAHWWNISGSYANTTLIRKPEIWHGNPVLGASLDEENPENFEWIKLHRTQDLGGSWGAVVANIGQHHFIPPTHYISTVSSAVYKVSEGYSMTESIKGMTTGTTVADFLANIVRKNENQVLKVLSVADGTVLGMEAVLSMNDTLEVMSADSINMTKYVLEVTDEGFSSDAKLTSTRYEITIDAEPKSAGDAHTPGSGSITGFEYGTTLQTVVNNVKVPTGATMSVISSDGAYVPFKQLNFDTAYVSVTVNADTYFEVLAENGVTTIMYQLLPRASESEAFVLSDLYTVSQANLLIDFVPRGTNVQSFLANLVPSMGASVKLVDKWGLERMDGTVADDDKLVVTSPDGTTTKVYHISKLATQYVRETTYLAYILSNVYTIDQVDYLIHGASGIADISEFYSRIRTAQGATAVVVDVNGAEKTTGHLAGTDMVKVTSADGRITVMYSFATLVSANSLANSYINIYPNPTKEKLNISGVEPGSRIRIFNSTGKMLNNIEVKHSVETVSLEGFASGVYFVIISNENTITGKHKVVKF